MPNLNCWGPGESVDTHIVGVWNKKDKVPSGYPLCPQGPGGPESAQNVKSWLLGPGESVDTHIVGVRNKKTFGKNREFYQLSFWLLSLLLYKIC